jgi:hypothetical protein
MRTTALSRVSAVVFAAIAPALAHAQCVSQRLPTSASTRGIAMGDANTAGRDDDVIFYGPAQLAIARGTSAAAERYFDGLASGTVASTARIATGGAGIGAQIVDGRNVDPCPTPTYLSNGQVLFTPSPRNFSRSLVVVGAAQTFKRVRYGAAAKFASEQADAGKTSRFLVDLGVSRDFTVTDFLPLTVALAVQNLGTSAVDTVQLVTPLRAALGLSTGGPWGPLDVALAAQLAVEQNDTLSILHHGRFIGGIGTELGYAWLDGYSFAIRAGERVPPTRTVNLRHFTFGAGLVLDRVSVDYAGEDMVGGIAHRIGIRLR